MTTVEVETEDLILATRLVLSNKIAHVKAKVMGHNTAPLTLQTVQRFRTEAKDWGTKLDESLAKLLTIVKDTTKRNNYAAHTNTTFDEIGAVIELIDTLEKHLNPTPVIQPQPNQNQRTAAVKLPKLDLPTFDGEILQWKTFIDMFKASVDGNTSLSKVQKFTYLKAALSGEAESCIADLSLSDINYDTAMATLENRYENPRRIKLAVVHDFLAYVPSKGADGLRGLVDKLSQMTRIFSSLNMDAEAVAETIITYLTQEKMDKEARKQWKLTWTDKDLPRLGDLKKFLAEHAERRIAEDDEVKHMKTVTTHHIGKANGEQQKDSKPEFRGKNDKFKQRPVKPKPYSQRGAPSAIKCNFGCSQSHKNWECPRLLETRTEDRFEYVKQNNLCVNCLGKHRLSDCLSKRTCYKCKGKHNTVLHYDHWKGNQHAGTTYFTANQHNHQRNMQQNMGYNCSYADTMQGGGATGPSSSQQQ